jgi:hypothetical protein
MDAAAARQTQTATNRFMRETILTYGRSSVGRPLVYHAEPDPRTVICAVAGATNSFAMEEWPSTEIA